MMARRILSDSASRCGCCSTLMTQAAPAAPKASTGDVRFVGAARGPSATYLPPISTGITAEHAGRHVDHTAVHGNHKIARMLTPVLRRR